MKFRGTLPGKRALGSQWVYHIKYFSDGFVEHLKSCLVVLGHHQEVGVDNNETLSPVSRVNLCFPS